MAGPQESPLPVISGITVEVDGKPGEPALLDLIPIKVGETYSPRVVDQVVKQIFSTGLFSDVRVEMTGDERVALRFVLVRNLFVRKVLFRGAKVPQARLRGSLTALRPGEAFQEERLPDAVRDIQEGLRREGFFEAEVEVDVIRHPEDSTVDLVFLSSSWRTYIIDSLELAGDLVLSPQVLLKRMKSRVGDPYVPSRLERDLEIVADSYANVGYQRAELELVDEEFDAASGEVKLRIEIRPQEKISIIINGARIPGKLLAPIWEERIFEEWGQAEGEVRILNHLRRKGFLYAEIQSRIERPENEIRVIYDITPGPKYRISEVTFEGNTAFTSERLKTHLAVSEKILFFALISYDRLFAIPREIELFYHENGYPDVQVELRLDRRGESVGAVYSIREGVQQKIASIRLDGVKLFTPVSIRDELVSREGGPYFPPNVQRDIGMIENYYLNQGMRGTQISPRVEPTGDNTVSLIYEIMEGHKVRIKNIFISGNNVTRTRVIRKEIQVRIGEEADYSKIQETERRLERLGIFSSVKVEEIQTDQESEVLVVTVREGERNYLGLGVGLESLNPAGGSLSSLINDFRPRGTAEFVRSNTFGIGAQLSLVGQYSLLERRAIASWNQPYLFGMAMPTTVMAWLEREERESFGFDRRGVSWNTIRPLSRSHLLLATLSLTRTELTFVDIEDPDLDIDRRLLPYSAALASLSMIWEKRDDTLNPEKGHFFSIVGEKASPLFGMESNYIKAFLKYQVFRPLTSSLNLGLTVRLGVGSGLRNLPERFFAGGSNSFRGEEFDQLGPIDPITEKPVGGEAVFLINADTKFRVIPTWDELALVGFFDLGNVFLELRDFQPFDLQGAFGFGIRYKTALGPVRLEMAWKLWRFDAADKKGKPRLFLTIGNIF